MNGNVIEIYPSPSPHVVGSDMFDFISARLPCMATYMELNVKESLLIVQQVTMIAYMELNVKELLLNSILYMSIGVVE